MKSSPGLRVLAQIMGRFLVSALLLVALGPSRAEAQAAHDGPWTLTAQVGGTVFLGHISQYADGHLVSHRNDAYEQVHYAFDTRASLTRAFGRLFALTGQLSYSNWQSEYRYRSDHDRSNYAAIALSPELRIPFGRCVRCPGMYLAPRGGFVLSQLGQGAAHAAVKEQARFGIGGVAGFRGGLMWRIHRRINMGLKLETGLELTWLRHDVAITGAGHEQQRFKIVRPVNLIGFWWSL